LRLSKGGGPPEVERRQGAPGHSPRQGKRQAGRCGTVGGAVVEVLAVVVPRRRSCRSGWVALLIEEDGEEERLARRGWARSRLAQVGEWLCASMQQCPPASSVVVGEREQCGLVARSRRPPSASSHSLARFVCTAAACSPTSVRPLDRAHAAPSTALVLLVRGLLSPPFPSDHASHSLGSCLERVSPTSRRDRASRLPWHRAARGSARGPSPDSVWLTLFPPPRPQEPLRRVCRSVLAVSPPPLSASVLRRDRIKPPRDHSADPPPLACRNSCLVQCTRPCRLSCTYTYLEEHGSRSTSPLAASQSQQRPSRIPSSSLSIGSGGRRRRGPASALVRSAAHVRQAGRCRRARAAELRNKLTTLLPTFASLADARASPAPDRLLSARRSRARARSHTRYVPQLSMTCGRRRGRRLTLSEPQLTPLSHAQAALPRSARPSLALHVLHPSLFALARPSTLTPRPAFVHTNSPNSPAARLAGTAPRPLRRSPSPSWTVSARTSSRTEEQADDFVADLRLARRRSSLAGVRPPPLSATLRSPCAFSQPVRPSAQLGMTCECLRLARSPRARADPRREAQLTPLSHAQAAPPRPARPSLTPHALHPLSPRPRPPFDPRIPARFRPHPLAELAARPTRRRSSRTSPPVAFAKLGGIGAQGHTSRRAS